MRFNRFWMGLLCAPEGDAAGGGGAAAGEQAPAGPTREEFEALQAQLADTTRAAEFWQEKAASTKAAPAPKPAEEPEVDMLELLTTRGAKGFDEYMRAKGFVSREEVERTVNNKAAQLSKEQELSQKYPDLKNERSEFFKATAVHYGKLIQQGVPETLAMELAADRAELEGIRTGKVKTPAQKAEEDKQARERERRERIQAQAGDRSGRGAMVNEEDDELSPEQEAIAVKMLAGDGVSREQAIEAYKKRAKAGVMMGGRK